MIRGIKGLFILLFLLTSSSSCQVYERVAVTAPVRGELTVQTHKIFGQDRKIEVYFPVGAQKEDLELVFLEENGRLSCGADRNSKYLVQEIASVEVKGEAIIRVFLRVNHLRLPVYDSPEKKAFDEKRVFAGAGRMYRDQTKVKGVVVRHAGLCNAVLVGSDLVLTAAHCIEDKLDCAQSTFMIWNSQKYATYTCKELLVAKRSSDQALIRLESKPSESFSVVPVEKRELYFQPSTTVVILSDETVWDSGLLSGFKPKDGKGSKSLQPCSILGSAMSMQTSSGSDLSLAKPSIETSSYQQRLTNYALNCNAVPGQSGSGVLNLEGNLIGVLVATGGRFTPLDPEIAARLP